MDNARTPLPLAAEHVTAINFAGLTATNIEACGCQHMVVAVEDFCANGFGVVKQPQVVLYVEARDPAHRGIGTRKREYYVEEGVEIGLMAAELFRHHQSKEATLSNSVNDMIKRLAIDLGVARSVAQQRCKFFSPLDQIH